MKSVLIVIGCFASVVMLSTIAALGLADILQPGRILQEKVNHVFPNLIIIVYGWAGAVWFLARAAKEAFKK